MRSPFLVAFSLLIAVCVLANLSGGSAYAAGHWRVTCETDEFDDSHTCKIQKGGLAVILLSSGSKLITFGFDHYPGTSMDVRVDHNKGVSWKSGDFPQKTFDQVLNQMKSGSVIKMRYWRWPSYDEHTGSVLLEGFAVAYEDAMTRLDSLRSDSESAI